MPQIELYSYIKRYILTDNSIFAPNWNTPMTHTDFNVYVGIPAVVEFAVKNQDRKPVNLLGSRCKIMVTDVRTRQLYLTKAMQVYDDINGVLRLNLSASDISGLPLGFLGYSIIQERADGAETQLYHNRDGLGYGYFEVGAGVMQGVANATPLDPGTFTPSGGYMVSSSIPGSMQTGNNPGLHTVVIYMCCFDGKFWIEATLENDPAAPNEDWFDVQLCSDHTYAEFLGCSGIQAFSFTANTQWVRFKYQPNQGNQGEVKAILYKF